MTEQRAGDPRRGRRREGSELTKTMNEIGTRRGRAEAGQRAETGTRRVSVELQTPAEVGHVRVRMVRRPETGDRRREAADGQPVEFTQPVDINPKWKPEHAEAVRQKGCGMRSFISAAARASGERGIGATQAEWHSRLGDIENVVAAVKEGELAPALVAEVDRANLLQLYRDLGENNTRLGEAARQVEPVAGVQTIDEIKDAIREGNREVKDYGRGTQTLVIVPGHIFHAGLDKRGNVVALSDQKDPATGQYRTVDLSKYGKEFHTITLNPTEGKTQKRAA